MPARITATSAICSAGRGVEQLWASVRSGISRIASSHVMNRHFEPIQMGLVPEDALEPELPPEVELLPLPARARRMLRLGAPALRSILHEAGAPPICLYLGLPQLNLADAPWMKGFPLYLAKTAGTTLDAPNSRVVPLGRASALIAFELALDALERDPKRTVVVGGLDTYFDRRLLAELDAEGRILCTQVSDGFIPGEGASFLALTHSSAAPARDPGVVIEAAASAQDPGHRGGSEPARGEGLAAAIETLRRRLVDKGVKVASTFAGLNGESFDAKQWGVARLRHTDFFAPGEALLHPADCFGDAGAATGTLLVSLAARALAARQRPSPALVWAASDGESRACALVSSAEQ